MLRANHSTLSLHRLALNNGSANTTIPQPQIQQRASVQDHQGSLDLNLLLPCACLSSATLPVERSSLALTVSFTSRTRVVVELFDPQPKCITPCLYSRDSNGKTWLSAAPAPPSWRFSQFARVAIALEILYFGQTFLCSKSLLPTLLKYVPGRKFKHCQSARAIAIRNSNGTLYIFYCGR
jgi:hypothetical protein